MEIRCRNVTQKYGAKTVLEEVSLELESGGLIGLIGPNGAGKSTLMKILATLLKPTGGEVLLDGESIIKSPRKMRRLLGYLPQQVPFYPNLSAREYLEYLAAEKGLPYRGTQKQISALLSQLHLADTGRKALRSFSGGMRQRVGIAATLLGDPKVIIVDEPTTGLDPMERVTFRNLLSELAMRRIVLLSTHIVSDVEAVASKLVLLKEGRVLYQGQPERIVGAATGRVWEYTLPTGSLPSQEAHISSMVQGSAGVHVRAVADEPPTPDAVAVAAHLEDACLAILEGEV